MQTPQQIIERFVRSRQKARSMRTRLECGGWGDTGNDALQSLRKLTALESETLTLASVLEVDLAAMNAPKVRGASQPLTRVRIERLNIPPKPPTFPDSMTIYLLEVPADTSDDWQTGRWAAMLSPTQYRQLVAAVQGVPAEAYVAAVEMDDGPEGA